MSFFTRKKSDPRVKDLVADYFDTEFYLSTYPDVAAAGIDPLEHYLEHGAREGRDPAPWFSTSGYRATCAELGSSAINPFYHYLSHRSPDERQQDRSLVARTRTIQQRLAEGVLGEMVARATALEPLVRLPANTRRPIKIKPLHDDAPILMSAMKALHEAADYRPARYVVVIPHCRMSGATRIGGELAFALAALNSMEDVLLIRSDDQAFEYPQWFPAGMRNVDFAGFASPVNKARHPQLLFHFLRSLHPRAVFNINSLLFYKMTTEYGRPLSASMRVVNYLFCADRNRDGHEVGYPVEYVYKGLSQGAWFVTDSAQLAATLRARYLLQADGDQGRIRSLPTPVRALPQGTDKMPIRPPTDRSIIYWAGRFDRQKRIDLVQAIAARMPECDFYLFGKAVLAEDDKLSFPANVHVHPPFGNFAELPLEHCTAWLYTAEWDGIPTMILEVIAAGVPLVTSNCGGIAEVVDRELAGLIDDIEDIDAYMAAINRVISAPEQALANAEKLRQKALNDRSEPHYHAAVADLLGEL